MSKDFFKVKKGLNIKPQDPSGLSDLQDGDIIVDSTDDNRLKVYDSVGGDFASVGTGGSSGNILKDIEKLTPTVSNVVATTDTVTFLPIDDNNKSVKATFSGSDGSIRYEAAVSADLDGVQGTVEVWLKTSLDNLTISSTKDGVIQSSVSVNSTNKWRQYKIPVVLGDADYGFEISASGAVAGDVFIDEAFVKVKKLTENLGQAQFVGSQISSAADCRWIVNNNGSWGAFGTDADCTYTNTGNIQSPDTNIPAFKIPNARTDGYYQVFAMSDFRNQSGSDVCYFSLSSSSSFEDQHVLAVAGSENRRGGTVGANFKFSTSGEKTIQVISQSNSTNNCEIIANDGVDRGLFFTVHFFPDADSTIVTQDTELTAETANIFTAVIESDGTITSQNYDFLENCTSSNNCTFKSGIFTVNPSVTCSLVNNNGANADTCEINSVSTTGVTFTSVASNPSTLTNTGSKKYITVSKQGANVNKSQTIVGKFANINDTPLCQVKAQGNNGTVLTASVTPIDFTEVSDPCNAWSGDTYTAQKTSLHHFSGSTRTTTSTTMFVYAYVNTGSGFIQTKLANDGAITSTTHKLDLLIHLNEGDQLQFRTTAAPKTLNDLDVFHNLTITELPDLSAIVKNLSNEKTKCQTKILNSNVTTNTTVSDLTFSNLTLGKKYKVYLQARLNVSGDTSMGVLTSHDGTTIATVERGSGSGLDNSATNSIGFFTASDTSLTFQTFGFGGASPTLEGNGNLSATWARLCELPDTFVETTEW